MTTGTTDVLQHAPAPDAATTADETGAFAERVFGAVLGMMEMQAVYLGDRLGWYAALAERGPMTPGELAAATGTAPRYAREWLEHQAVSGYLTVDNPAAPADERRYTLPAAHAPVLADQESLYYLAPLARFLTASSQQSQALLEAYRTGGGVSWEQFGTDAREAQAAQNRPLFLHALCQELLPMAPEIDARLRAGARVADIGCGFGWSAIGLAKGYPAVTVDGFDVDRPSIEAAERLAARHGVTDRVRFHAVDAGQGDTPGTAGLRDTAGTAALRDTAGSAGLDDTAGTAGLYDVAFAFECVHDMSDPVGVLAATRRMLRPDGVMIIMDEKVEEAFTAPGSETERLFYGFSLVGCLPDGLSRSPSVGTGTVMRPATLAGYAAEAGFRSTDVLPIEHDTFRFYRLVP